MAPGQLNRRVTESLSLAGYLAGPMLRIAVMTSSASATAEIIVTTTPKQAFEISGPLDPARFYGKFGPLPAVVAVTGQSGEWDTAGRTRKLELSDGGSVIETITDVISPTLFAYDLSNFTGAFHHLVSGARAEWTFERTAVGTLVTWTYTFHGKPGRAWIVRAIVKMWWARYMDRVLPMIGREIERTTFVTS